MKLNKVHRQALITDLIDNVIEKEELEEMERREEREGIELDDRQQAWREIRVWKNQQQRHAIEEALIENELEDF